jgi:hypothetical protein
MANSDNSLQTETINTHTPNKGMIEENPEGSGEVSGEMVWARSEELGMIAGRPMNNVDYGQALRELTGGHKMDAKQASLESVPQAEHDQMPRAAKSSEKKDLTEQ